MIPIITHLSTSFNVGFHDFFAFNLQVESIECLSISAGYLAFRTAHIPLGFPYPYPYLYPYPILIQIPSNQFRSLLGSGQWQWRSKKQFELN